MYNLYGFLYDSAFSYSSVFLTRTNNCSIRWKKGNKGDSCIWEWSVRRIGTRIELLMIRSRESVQMMLFESFERKYIIDKFETNFQMILSITEIKHVENILHFLKSPLWHWFLLPWKVGKFFIFILSTASPQYKNLSPLLLEICASILPIHHTGLDSNHCLLEGCLLEWNSPAWRL